MKNLYLSLLLLFISTAVLAQDNALVFLKGIPQSTQVNPAFRPIKGNYLSLPALGSVKVNTQNTGFAWSDIITPGAGLQSDSLIVNLDKVSGSLQDNNIFATEGSIQIIGFGFSSENATITFDLNSRFKSKIKYPSSILNLRYGNWDYDNDRPINHSLSDMYINTLAYTEAALGYSRYIGDYFSVGIRVKYLFGIGNLESEKFNVEMQTYENSTIEIKNDVAIRTSMPIIISYDEDGYVNSISFDENVDRGTFFTNDNRGWGFDIGATYQPNSRLTIGAAINDLGFIKWKSRTQTFYSKGEFIYDGMDISNEIINEESDNQDYWDELADDFENSFKVTDKSTSYKTGIMASVNITAQYEPRQWVTLGNITKSYIINGKWIPETTLAAGLHAGHNLSTVLTYSIMKNAPANFGAGVMLKGGPFQLYCMTDHLNSVLNPQNSKYLNVRLGINLIY